MNKTLLRGVCAVSIASALGAGSLALAAGGNDDRAVAEALLAEVDRDPHKTTASDVTAKSRAALERARRLRTAGDELHARLADGLAREWAETARDLVKTAALEESSAKMRAEALDAGAQLERERLQLEEALARTGRLRAQLEQAEREAKEQGRTATPPEPATPPKKKPAKDGQVKP